MKTDAEQTNTQSNAILKELSDIKASLAVNTSETGNIKVTISEIKSDIKEIKSDSASRRELNETSAAIRRDYLIADNAIKEELSAALEGLKNDLSPLKKVMYGLMATVGLTIVGSLLKLVILPQ